MDLKEAIWSDWPKFYLHHFLRITFCRDRPCPPLLRGNTFNRTRLRNIMEKGVHASGKWYPAWIHLPIQSSEISHQVGISHICFKSLQWMNTSQFQRPIFLARLLGGGKRLGTLLKLTFLKSVCGRQEFYSGIAEVTHRDTEFRNAYQVSLHGVLHFLGISH